MNKKKKCLMLGVTAITLFLIILVSVIFKKELYIDNLIIPIITSMRSGIMTAIFKIITILGDKYFIALLVVCIAAFLWVKKKRFTAAVLVINLADIVILNKVVKAIVKRPRPIDMLIEKDGYSFPSGHAMLTIGVYGLLIYLINKSRLDDKIKKISTIVLSIIILLVGITRIYLGVHYPSDIIGGYLLSFAYLMIFILAIDKVKNKLKK